YALGGKDVPALQRAYDEISAPNSPYREFVNSLQSPRAVLGTWDDHDLGVNDAGGGGSVGLVPDLQQRQLMYQDLLGIAKDSPLRARKGVYTSHVFGMPKTPAAAAAAPSAGGQVKVILLDTRSGRTDYIFPPSMLGSVMQGNFYAKPFPLLAAALRVVSA